MSECDILLKDLGWRKIRAVCSASNIVENVSTLKDHKCKLLDFRDISERLACIKCPKLFARKDGHTEEATKRMEACKKSIKATKAVLHVYLHEPSRN